MKTLKTLLVIAIAVFGFATTSLGQANVSATAAAEGTVVTPLSITKTVDLNFGKLAVNNTPGTVVLTPGGARSTTGGVTLPTSSTGTVTAAAFTVTGVTDYTYAITLPSTATTLSDGTHSMTVDTWTSNPDATGTLTTGSETLNIGATLHVGASQAAGVYTSTSPFTVTVCYN